MKYFKTLTTILLVCILGAGFEACETEPEVLIAADLDLKYVNSIGVPLANPVGITSDDVNFWIMFGEHNAEEHQLIYYNPETYETERSFVFYDLIEELGTNVQGITWSGEYLWISVGGNTNKVVKVDPISGEILQTWSSPSVSGPVDVAFDRGLIWLSTGTGKLYTINPNTGGSELALAYKHDDNYRDSGVLIRDDKIWVGDLFDRLVYIYDVDTKEFLGRLYSTIHENGKFCLYQDQFVVLSEGGIKFYEIID